MEAITGSLQATAAGAFIEELKRQGVTQFFAAPGNRSALLIEAVVNNPETSLRMHYDERGAAYMALGYGRAHSKPAALITTSGGAVANCFPAVVEATKDRVPLIVITADRPAELRYTGANQTIDQLKIFGSYVKDFIELPPPTDETPLAMHLNAAAQAVFLASKGPRGPFHINYQLREPFFSKDSDSSPGRFSEDAEDYFSDSLPFLEKKSPARFLEQSELSRLKETISLSKRGLVVVGKLEVSTDRDIVVQFLKELGWPVLADITSGLRHFEDFAPLVPYYDQILLGKDPVNAQRPDCVLHFGGQLVSKRLQKFLEGVRVTDYIQVGNYSSPNDPGYLVSWFVECDPAQVCRDLLRITKDLPKFDPNFLLSWSRQSKTVESIISEYCRSKTSLDEIVIPNIITSEVGENGALFLGSSMPIRDFDMYSSSRHSAIKVDSNRGASGIDGNLATAAGFAMAIDCPLTIVLGDLAFLHDLNSLGLLREQRHPCAIIVINNDGGGIFSFVEVGARTNLLDPYFATPHGLKLEPFVRGFGLRYETCSTPGSFRIAYKEALSRKETTVFELFTDRDENFKAHRALQSRIIDSLFPKEQIE